VSSADTEEGSDSLIPGWVRWVTIADGVAHDSFAVSPTVGGSMRGRIIAGGRRLLLWRDNSELVTVTSTTRTGEVTDSAIFRSPLGWRRMRVTSDGHSLLVFMPRAKTPDDADLLRYAIDDRGHIATIPDTLVRQMRNANDVALSASGILAYVFEVRDYSVWALRRDGPASMQFTQQRLAASTTSLEASISPAGDRALLIRPAASADGRRQLSVMSFDSGPETLLGPPLDLLDARWALDGQRVLFSSSMGSDSTKIGEIDISSGALKPLFTAKRHSSASWLAAPLSGGGLIFFEAEGGFRRIGLAGLPDSSFPLSADSIQMRTTFTPSPDGRSFAIFTFREEPDSFAVYRVSIVDGSMSRYAGLPSGIANYARWLDDGSMLVSYASPSNVLWYQVPGNRGVVLPMGSPPLAPAAYRMSNDGRRVTATKLDRRTDIYLIPNFGELLR
jgi:hypothetical protein